MDQGYRRSHLKISSRDSVSGSPSSFASAILPVHRIYTTSLGHCQTLVFEKSLVHFPASHTLGAAGMSQALSVHDGTLWFEVVAGGKPHAPPIIALHGGLGLDHTTLRPWLDPLAAHAACLVFYDHRGNGRSSNAADWSHIDHKVFAEDTEALRARLVADGLPADRVVLFGHSYGGFLALEYALRYPGCVAGLVLCATGPALQHGTLLLENARARSSDVQFATLLALLGGPLDSDEMLEQGIRAIAPLYFHNPSRGLCSAVFDQVVFRAQASNRSLFALAPQYDVRGSLGAIAKARIPILLIGGSDDWLMPSSVALDALAAELPNATRVEVPNTGHFPFAEEPSLFLDAVNGWFLRSVSNTRES